MNLIKIERTDMYQRGAHAGQKRKFSGLPYHTHPQAVAQILLEFVPDVDETMIQAALLHDTMEDTGVTMADLVDEFGPEVAAMVDGLTNRKKYFPGTNRPMLKREAQKRLDARRLSTQCNRVKTIKLADKLHNLPDIIENDPKHAKVYVPEARHLLDTALVGGNQDLWNRVDAICSAYEAQIA